VGHPMIGQSPQNHLSTRHQFSSSHIQSSLRNSSHIVFAANKKGPLRGACFSRVTGIPLV
jgi:hypothetical protein